jgi:imidazolonepropionase-like amidohydrolase
MARSAKHADRSVGKAGREPRDVDYEVDATGMFVTPGFIDMHFHGASDDKTPDMSYSYKLWLAHGVTTVRGVDLAPFEISLSERGRSARNEIVAPRIFAYQRPGQGKGWTGGRVTTGSHSGFIFKPYGFGYIQELELLQEAGFNPSQVIQSATLNGALTLYEPKGEVPPLGTVRVGNLADLVIVKENPLQNFKTLYGTGALRLNEKTQQLERVGGVSYTVKDGIVYDAKKLLADVADMVVAEKRRMGLPEQGLAHR